MASLIAQGGYYEWHITNGETTYNKDQIMSGTITDAVSQDGGIGNVIAKQLNVRLWNADIDATQPLVVTVTEHLPNGATMTYPKGTFLIDTVAKSPYSEYCEVTAFDALLKTEVIYLKEGEWSTKTSLEVAQEIATDIGVELNADTEWILDEFGQEITQAPSIGQNGTTSRQMLSVIGVMNGGNWIINDDNELELRLLMLKAGILRINNNGNFVVSDFGAGGIPAFKFVSIDDNGDFQSIDESELDMDTLLVYVDWKGHLAVEKAEKLVYSANVVWDAQEVGNEVVTFDVSPTEYVTRIELQNNGSVMFRSPSGMTDEEWEEYGGKILMFNMPLMASQELADSLLERLSEIEYVPYTANGVYIDPWIPLGTALHIKNDWVLLSNRTLNIDPLASCDLTAEPTQELQSNYPYIDPVVREARQKIDENYAAIYVEASKIRSEVYTKTETEGRISSAVEQTASSITDTFTRELQEAEGRANDYTDDKTEVVTSYIRRYDNGSETGIEIGRSDSPFKAKLTNSELSFTGESGEKAAWINANQLYINEAAIPSKDSSGNIIGKWVQQTTASGHFQIRWESSN